MDNKQFKEMRKAIGLTRAQLAKLLDTDTQSVQRIEMPPTASTARSVAPRMERLMNAYASGYRPPDWPV